MKILAFDTSSSACSVALQHGEHIESRHLIAPMQQAKLILPMIQELLSASSLSFHQLDAVAYGCGPGSFTGCRLACSVAQGIGLAAQLPLIPVSSLAAIAETAWMEKKVRKCLVTLDARMEEVYWAAYQVKQGDCMALIDQEKVSKPHEIKLLDEIVKGEDCCGVGDGWEKYEEQLITQLGFQPKDIYPSLLPHATAILKLAKERVEQRDWISPSQVMPAYLR